MRIQYPTKPSMTANSDRIMSPLTILRRMVPPASTVTCGIRPLEIINLTIKKKTPMIRPASASGVPTRVAKTRTFFIVSPMLLATFFYNVSNKSEHDCDQRQDDKSIDDSKNDRPPRFDRELRN